MCGIAGIIKWTHEAPPPWAHGDSSSLQKMSNALAHRGPDGHGLYTDPRPSYTAALLHRRLAVIDLACGQQPMANETGDVHVAFNGEIYNHAELRRELQSAGHTFKTDHSDTEVLLHGWEQWGTDLPSHLLGMFAFAIWDTRNNDDTLFLARDRMGQKPLFYATLEDGLVFGSTIPSVLAWPEVPRRVPFEQIGLYFLLGYFPGPQTVYRDISRILPGGWLRIRKDLVDGGLYWTPAETGPQIENPKSKIENPSQRLRALLQNAVSSQLVSDVPLACFLSGGIDSSIIASLMQREVLAKGGNPIQTVSVGFREAPFDETAYAQTLAQKIGSRHTRLEVDASTDPIGLLRALMQTSLGEPYADSSILPTYHLSKAVRQLATVALSGDGADELFAGYDRYRAMVMLGRWGNSARLMAHLLPKAVGKNERVRRFLAAARASILSERYTRLVEIFPLDLAENLLGQEIMDWYPLPEEYGLPDDVSPLRFAMRRDQQEYLPGDVLWKVDSASMSPDLLSAAAVGPLEVRSPFLDHHLVQFANALPDSAYLRNNTGKAILRNTFRDLLPPTIAARGKKGFGVPIGDWFRTTLKSPLTDLLFSTTSFTTHHLNKSVAEKLLAEHLHSTRNHTHRLFALLMLELWWHEFSPSIEK